MRGPLAGAYISSFSSTSGGGGIKILRGGSPNFFDTRKGGPEEIRRGSQNLYTLNPKGVDGGGGS